MKRLDQPAATSLTMAREKIERSRRKAGQREAGVKAAAMASALKDERIKDLSESMRGEGGAKSCAGEQWQ